MGRSPLLVFLGILLVLSGLVWILQGLDVAFAPKSFMTNNGWWVLWGVVAMVTGVFAIARASRDR